MSGAKDPDEFIKKFGATRFKMLLDDSEGAVNFELEKCRSGLDLNSEPDKIKFLKNAVMVLAGISNRLERDVYISKTAKMADINIEILRAQVNDEIRKNINIDRKKEWQAIRSRPYFTDKLVPESAKAPRQVKAEEGILAYLFKFPDKIKYTESLITPDYFITEFYRRVYVYYCEHAWDNENFSVSSFAGEFTDEEMGRIVGIEAEYREITITEHNLNDYINILTDYKNKPSSVESDDDLVNIIKAKRKKS